MADVVAGYVATGCSKGKVDRDTGVGSPIVGQIDTASAVDQIVATRAPEKLVVVVGTTHQGVV